MENIKYENLRMDVLETLIEQRDIKCRKTKNEMVKHLILDDDEKYIRETVYEKTDKDSYLIGVDINNTEDLIKISKLVEKNIVKASKLFQKNRIYFFSKEKIEL